MLEWLMWQVSGLGPMLGQNGHFLLYATEKIPYAIARYGTEARRLYGVLDARLAETNAYVAGDDYTIADIACFPWVMTHKAQGIDLDEFVHVRRWFTELRGRPQLQKGLAIGRKAVGKTLDETARKHLFGQDAGSAKPNGDPA